MPIDIESILARGADDHWEAFAEHVNPQWAKVLRTIGFDRTWTRAEGAHLFDQDGNRFLDCMTGWGVFKLRTQTIRRSSWRSRPSCAAAIPTGWPSTLRFSRASWRRS